MKKLLSMRNVLIAITFTVVLLFLKDNLDLVFRFFNTLITILTPFLIGFLFAYILNFPYKFFYNKAFGRIGLKHKPLQKVKKPLAIICTYLIVVAVIVMITDIVIPQIAQNIINLVKSMPEYIESLMKYLNDGVDMINDNFNTELSIDQALNNAYQEASQWLTVNNITSTASGAASFVYDMIASTTSGLYNFVMGLVISVYLLAEKETLLNQVKRLAVAFIPIKRLPKVYEIVDITDTKCGRFLVGDIIDAAFVGLLIFVTMSIFQIPYAALIGVIIGVTNIIPFFGPFIGGIPSALILFLVSPRDMIVFLIILFIIQQLDGNLFKPKIIGNQVGLSSFWVLFAVIVGGALFGIVGFVLGVPIYAVIYTLIGKRVRNSIKEKGKIAQEALEFEVLNYAQIAEEQKKIREEKERHQREKFMKLLRLDKSDDNEAKENEQDTSANSSEKSDDKGKEKSTTDKK